jgi:aminoacrylate hydrolase
VYHEIHGPTDPGAPTVVLSSGLGGAAHYWQPQIPALAEDFRVITYDQQGTGRSPGSVPENYSIADMAAELLDLLDTLQIARTHFIGHALGGLIGLQLAVLRPALLDRIVLVNAWSKTDPHTIRCFAARKSLLLNTGIAAYVQAQPLFLYPAAWLAGRQDWLAQQDETAIAHFPPIPTVLRRIHAIETFDLSAQVSAIEQPTLLVAARDDVLVPCTCSNNLAEQLSRSQLEILDHGGHACNITETVWFNTTVKRFLLEA